MKYIKLFEENNNEFYFLHKEPKYLNLFKQMHKDGKSIKDLKDLYDNIVRKRSTLKSQNIDLSKKKSFEEIYDALQRMDLIERANKYIKLIPAHLRADVKKHEDEFADIIIDYDNYEDYKNVFIKKSNKYRTMPDFIKALKNHINSFEGVAKILKKVKETPDAEIVKSTPEFLVVYVPTYDSCEKLGSSQWCIVTSKHYFSDYTFDKFGKQYIVWDFEFDATDKRSMVGITAYTSGKYTAHFKNDNSCSEGYYKMRDWFEFIGPYDKNDLNKMDDRVLAAAIDKNFAKLQDLTYSKQVSVLRAEPHVINKLDIEDIKLFKKLSKEVDYKVLDEGRKLLYKKINRTKEQIKYDNEVDVFAFLGKSDFKELPNGHYEKVLYVERFIKIDPYNINDHMKMSMMKRRGHIQGDLQLYRIAIQKGLFDEDELNDLKDENNEETSVIMKSIEQKMERI